MIKKLLIACGIGIIVCLLCYLYFSWVALPIESCPYMLTLVNDGGPSIKRVTLSHYVNNIHINDYVLDLKIRIHYQNSQTYELPQLKEGVIKVNLELDHETRNFTINYEDILELYEKGLLIYSTNNLKSSSIIDGIVDYDQYVYFISGVDKTCYFEKAHSSEWVITTEVPQIKRFTRKEKGYSPIYYGWKENKWVVLPAQIE